MEKRHGFAIWKTDLSSTGPTTVEPVASVLPTPRKNPSKMLPIYSGEPKGVKHLGAVFSEVEIGRNILKDVGEVVQDIYRGLIGGRQTMSEKRMAMAVATMEKELSDRAKAKGGNAVANLKLDFEQRGGSKVISVIAVADAVKLTRPPARKAKARANPVAKKKLQAAKKAYKDFHGGKKPENVEKVMVDIGEVWYSLGPVWCIGYMSNKEGFGEEQKYIHHTNEESKDGDYPMLYATMPESGEQMFVMKGGTMKIGPRDGLGWLID
jgi:uncharacterized protein YbjQ (UPF0145 family)